MTNKPQKKKILLLSANPKGTSQLRLDEEKRSIKEGLRRSRQREQYEIDTAEAVRYRDISRAILDYEPNIIHFSGHGAGEEGLVFEDQTGHGKLVNGEALAELFELFADQVECVVLNACYSEVQAQEIAQHINYVIGMSQAIGDRAAIEFAIGFYDALGTGRSYQFAYKLGCNLIRVAGIPENLTPQLLTKNHPAPSLPESELEEVKLVSEKGIEERQPTYTTPTDDIDDLSSKRGVDDTRKKDNKAPTPPTFPSLQVFEFDVVTLNTQGQEIKRSRRQSLYFEENLGNGIVMEMVVISGGTFQMGSSEGILKGDEKPQHEVTVSPFFMGKYPVTQAQWKAIASLPKVNRDLNSEPSNFKGDNLPVEHVSWYDAVEFCERLSRETGREYRLPSEAEWEYACRAGTTTPFHFGLKITREVVNCKRNLAMTLINLFGGEPTEVGSFKVANAFGLYDMHGQVWEWCEDDWHDSYRNAPTDGSAWGSGVSSQKVNRGGTWVDNPFYCRSATRSYNTRDRLESIIGFRVVCVAPRTT